MPTFNNTVHKYKKLMNQFVCISVSLMHWGRHFLLNAMVDQLFNEETVSLRHGETVPLTHELLLFWINKLIKNGGTIFLMNEGIVSLKLKAFNSYFIWEILIINARSVSFAKDSLHNSKLTVSLMQWWAVSTMQDYSKDCLFGGRIDFPLLWNEGMSLQWKHELSL